MNKWCLDQDFSIRVSIVSSFDKLSKQPKKREIRQPTIYYTIYILDDGTNELSIKSLMFQLLLFFILFTDLEHSKLFIFIFVIL